MPDLTRVVEGALGRELGRPVHIARRSTLAGGSINRTERIDTSAGVFVLKSHDSPPPGFFHSEADGLAALATGATPLAIPRVIACSDESPAFLVLEFLKVGPRGAFFDERLGHGLAALHRATARRFGFARDNYCGATKQRNTWCDNWVEFYATRRLGDQLAAARQSGLLPSGEAARVGSLIGHLDRWIAEPPEGPALTHGDLWSGNLHGTESGEPALIDPAVSFSHREAELGMMMLFGGFSPRVFEAYHEAFPLDHGWRDRNALYQLYHLLNHLNLFGRSYRTRVMAIVDRFV